MKLLVFEYSSVFIDDYLVFEGYYMLKGLLNDLNNLSFFDTYFLINEKLDDFCFNNCQAIYPNCELFDWLEKNINNFDYCLFIAPEDDLIQYKITKILEENNITVLCSDSNASFLCSSKYLTYLNVSEDILKIKTFKIDLKDITLINIEEIFKYNFIIKPDDKTSSNLIYHVTNKEELENVLDIYMKNNINSVLLQEYISGESVSVSVLCNENEIECISVNSQIIKNENNIYEYIGCVAPISHEYKNELYEISERIIKEIPGLNGFIGLDFIIHEGEIYFVELNSRLTTPFIVLQKKCNENLTENIIKTIINKKIEKTTFNGTGKFIKRR